MQLDVILVDGFRYLGTWGPSCFGANPEKGSWFSDVIKIQAAFGQQCGTLKRNIAQRLSSANAPAKWYERPLQCRHTRPPAKHCVPAKWQALTLWLGKRRTATRMRTGRLAEHDSSRCPDRGAYF